MNRHGNFLDVSSSIDVTDPAAVRAEVLRIFHGLYPGCSSRTIERAFHDVVRIYQGSFPGFHACDTPYHDIQHVLDVTLAMARLLDGHERTVPRCEQLGAALFRLGTVTALFHDVGYVRRLDDNSSRNGAEMTLTHVSRGASFLRSYLPAIGLGALADVAATLIHFTGYEIAVADIAVSSTPYRRLGCLLGSADIIAQMSDRCYLEKCYERLYPEFVLGGIDRKLGPDGKEEVLFASAEDLIYHTPQFYRTAMKRLHQQLDAMMRFAEDETQARNLYVEEAEKNIKYAKTLAVSGDLSALRRRPPQEIVPTGKRGKPRR